MLALSGQRLNRQESAVEREQARRARHQAEIDRAAAEGERSLGAWLRDPSKPIERAKALHQQAVAAMQAFATTEEEVARIFEELASGHPERRNEYRRPQNRHARCQFVDGHLRRAAKNGQVGSGYGDHKSG